VPEGAEASSAPPGNAMPMSDQPTPKVIDREAAPPPATGWAGRLASLIFIGAGVFHLYVAGFGSISTMSLLTLHWIFMSVPLFLLHRWKRGSARTSPTPIDLLWAVAALVSGLYIFWVWPDRMYLLGGLTPSDFWLGLVMVVLVLEAARRSIGIFLPLVSFAFLLYGYFGPYMPGWLAHKGYGFDRIIEELYITTGGIYGIPIGVSATFIIVFVLFGTFLQGSGGGRFFIDLAYAVAGRYRGGPAKTAVVSSALMGMISGSPVANVVTTGTFTIPLMKRTGYSDVMAGAVEACASTGGMFTPPVMGAAAFIIAEFMQVPYSRIALAAAIPAFLFYLAVFFHVDIYAVKRGLLGLPREDLPDIKRTFLQGVHLLLAILVLIGMLVLGYSPMKTAFWSIVLLFGLGLLRRGTRMGPRAIIQALENGARNTVPVATACACAGIIVGVVGLTGIGVKFSAVILRLGDVAAQIIPHLANLGLAPETAKAWAFFLASLMAMVLGMISALVLGCGMPPTAVYVIMASLAIPAMATALAAVGVRNPALAAHFFAFHFSTIGAITPPVALAAYAAAAISGGDPFRTGVRAFRIGFVAYIVPFMFAYSTALLFEGPLLEVVEAFVTAVAGVLCVTAATEGFLFRPVPLLARPIFMIAGLLLIKPGVWTDLAGIGLAGVGILLMSVAARSRRSRSVPGGPGAAEEGPG